MVCAPVRSIIPSLKLGDYLSVQAHKPCSISHISALKNTKLTINTKSDADDLITRDGSGINMGYD